ncbi:glycosyltransferase family 2 protein [Commensalibacter papalotli (ex Botero et al. 2024)]|uniref:Glycosyltransferase involved in cell wall bisynthesis (WcaA) (PDB:5MLZ) n=1 Tax=Commensalibacter papalotli (ex Botero et al. 2024) TaxID=2972766 RepID=A0ABM9HNQ2_9PROT|nr:glycosyltransferase family 2 protein [Commensalibacter papalotli (ex Botero et al. 2024)]CAI3936433.1 Glycosyltransferase involved in cell wall bisynthesis (WcaA) (PDB:5MLZ) [Commensalibacter papalotli (ex Botero et al. 2024)]CAI3939226.1 Glycosyltransferase involved in cell wall bisynthesis (WcaA) (PDB:5MLZ) [Commensalibacter papalotli (ex Botero et al. 2024)]
MTIQSRFTGFCQEVKDGIVVGWAINIVAPQEHVILFVYIDDQKIAEIKCDQNREDIQKQINFLRGDIGFQFIIPDKFRDEKKHELCFRFSDNNVLLFLDPQKQGGRLPFISFSLSENNKVNQYVSYIDGWKNGAINGWILKKDLYTGQYTGNCVVKVFVNGTELKTISANRYRPDVASASGGDPYCGFSVVVPTTLRRRYRATFRLLILPEEIDVEGSPYEATLIDDVLEQQLIVMNNHVDSLYKEITQLRKEIQKLVASPEYVIEEYDVWARKYFPFLEPKTKSLQQQIRKKNIPFQNPLVTIICPVYDPELQYFSEAVESVFRQTYQNWELLLIDDGGKSTEIKKELKSLAKEDPRIKVITLKENKGISAATNAGIKKATGEWITFFDHDDLLVPQALEIMLYSAYLQKAKIVYSDEDKLENSGIYIQPHFKPDFNYRYLLGINYICHFLMVSADLVKKVGQLRSKYDGAQDHDFLLRLTEITPHDTIYHLPEILYHWRMTRNSTAETIDHKHYAIDAGVACVSDHLKRMKKPAIVSSLDGSTAYQIEWKSQTSPHVAIIIPFKDQAEITQECVDRLLKNTNYINYTILLVDNGSCEEKTLRFLEEYKKHDRIEILPIHEEFNFARLNNLAANHIKAEFYLFLNNDVFVDDPNWLTKLVNEAALFDDVGIVGSKLLYPNGRVQHAGVIVSLTHVADHLGKGEKKDDEGYIKRSILSQELTAVTAAMMLVKASVFHEVNGFNEIHLKIAFNDVDLCLRVKEAGYKVVFCADCVAVHHESLSRGSDDQPKHKARFEAEIKYMNDTWKDTKMYQNDPAYSPYFLPEPPFFHNLVDPDK